MLQALNKPIYSALAVATVVVAATSLYLPFVDGLRHNRDLLIGTVVLFGLAAALTRISLSGSLLLAFLSVRFMLSGYREIVSPLYGLLVATLLFYAGVRTFGAWEKHRTIIYNTICVVVLVNVALEVLQQFGIGYLRQPQVFTYPLGLMSNSNETSAFLAICLPFFLRGRWWLGVPVVFLGLALAHCLQGFLIVSVVACVWMARQWRPRAWGLVYAPAIVFLLFFALTGDHFKFNSHMQGRGIVWIKTAKAIMVKPVAGWGFGQYQYVIPLLTAADRLGTVGGQIALQEVADKAGLVKAAMKVSRAKTPKEAHDFLYDRANNTLTVMKEAHNEYIELAFTAGFIGLGLLLLFIVATIRRGFKAPDITPVLVVLASCVSATVLFTWQLVPLMVVSVLGGLMVWGKEAVSDGR